MFQANNTKKYNYNFTRGNIYVLCILECIYRARFKKLHISQAMESPALDTLLHVWSHQCWIEGKDHLSQPAGKRSPNIAQDTAAFTARTHCWLMFNLVTPRSFSAKLLSSQVVPSMSWCLGLLLPRCWTLQFPLLNFMRFLSAHFSSLSRSFWMAAKPYSLWTTPSSFVSSGNLLRVQTLCNSTLYTYS